MKITDVLKKIGGAIGVICVPIAFMDVVGHPSVVQGCSMEPTLCGNQNRWWKCDTVWVNKLRRTPHAGDIFVFTYPRDPNRAHIKRVAHVAGEMIRLRNQDFFQIPENHFWMVSDNSTNANDSYVYGPVNRGLFKGQATRIIWPPNRWRKL